MASETCIKGFFQRNVDLILYPTLSRSPTDRLHGDPERAVTLVRESERPAQLSDAEARWHLADAPESFWLISSRFYTDVSVVETIASITDRRRCKLYSFQQRTTCVLVCIQCSIHLILRKVVLELCSVFELFICSDVFIKLQLLQR